MLQRFLERGNAEPLAYPLGNRASSGRERDVTPVVLVGDPTRYRQLWHICPFKNKTTKSVFSYHEDDAPSDKEKLCDLWIFRRSAHPGLELNAVETCAIEHGVKTKRKIKTDVHIYLLGMDLLTGRQINHYYHASDLARFDLVKRIINLARGYAEPAAIERSRLYGNTREGASHEVAEQIQKIVARGKATTREEVALQLEQIGYRPVRKKDGTLRSNTTLTVVTPGGVKTRIKGDLFHPNKVPEVNRQLAKSRKELPRLLERLNRMCLKKAERNWMRYRKRLRTQTYAEAKANNFGFVQITLAELNGTITYEPSIQRNTDAVAIDFAGTEEGYGGSQAGAASVKGHDKEPGRAVPATPAIEELHGSNSGAKQLGGSVDENPGSGEGSPTINHFANVQGCAGLNEALGAGAAIVAQIDNILRLAAQKKIQQPRQL